MPFKYRRLAGEVGYGTRDFENPVVSARRQPELLGRALKETAAGPIRTAEAIDLRIAEPRVAAALALDLDVPCTRDACSDHRTRFPGRGTLAP